MWLHVETHLYVGHEGSRRRRRAGIALWPTRRSVNPSPHALRLETVNALDP